MTSVPGVKNVQGQSDVQVMYKYNSFITVPFILVQKVVMDEPILLAIIIGSKRIKRKCWQIARSEIAQNNNDTLL